MEHQTIVEAIRANAAQVALAIRTVLGEDSAFDERAVRWLDEYVERKHETSDPKDRDQLVSMLGSFFGECIIRSYGGEWVQFQGSWCVCLDENDYVFPFAKVAKQLENGSEDSVLSFFTLIPLTGQPKGGRA